MFPSIALITGLLALAVSAVPAPVVDSGIWPVAISVVNSGTNLLPREMSNQERIVRGLSLNKPKRLFNVKRDMEKRLVPQPTGIRSQQGKSFFFATCANPTGGQASVVTGDTTFAAVNACATLRNIDFGVAQISSGTYLCLIGWTTINAAACDGSNYALYTDGS